MSNKNKAMLFSSSAADFRDRLVSDFFAYADGNFDDIAVQNDLGGIDGKTPPDAKQLGIMMFRCQRIWIEFCQFNGLPGESQRLFSSIIRKKWVRRMTNKKGKMT